MTAKGNQASSWGDGNVIKLDCGDVTSAKPYVLTKSIIELYT